MASIETTLGPLPVSRLGRVNSHDHIILEGGLTTVDEPDYRLDDVHKASAELTRWRAAGGGVIVDAQPFGCGRNVEKLVAVSRASEIPIVVATGFQHRRFYLPDHWQYRYDDDDIYDLLLAEVSEGVDANNYDGPLVRRLSVKAGVVKVAGDYNYVGENMQRLIGVVGRLHQATGVPVFAHTERGTAGEQLLDLLQSAGVPPDRVMLSHVDRNPDFYVHQRLAQRGAYLQYDSPSRIKYQPEHLVVDLMRRLFDAGLGDHILLGGDMARRSYWKAYGGGPGFDYLLRTFTDRLRQEGFTAAEIEQVWVHNPTRWLAPGSPQDSV